MSGRNWYLFYLLSAFLFGCILFLIGFFPVDIQKEHAIPSSEPPITLDGIRLKQPQKQVSNVIFMIIDAFRYDFLSKKNMPYTSNHCKIKLKTNVPTVTMPRIKSLTSGTISNFIDIILNLGSSQPLPDSILHRLKKRGDVIVFFGDDSWVKLFSSHINRYQTNSDSFFIQEFYEADANITKNLRLELKDMNSWDFMALHYIGLDRIGHVEGSSGEKITLKLKEMDNVVELIDKTFLKKDSKPQPLLLVTGDHGMREGGGHGGSSLEELYVPLVVSNRNCSTKTKEQILEYDQVDIAPTLALLLGIPIPTTSIGCIIPELLEGMSDEDKLYMLYYNTKFLMEKAIAKFGQNGVVNKDYHSWYRSAIESHKSYIITLRKDKSSSSYLFENSKLNYMRSANKISELFASSYVGFDFSTIIIGVTLTTLSGIIVVLKCITIRRSYTKILNPVGYYASLCMTALLISFVCYIFQCWDLKNIIIMTIPIFIVILLAIELMKIFTNSRIQCWAYIPLWAVCGIVFHSFSLCSTSFIEEEHQAWYYMGSTFLLVLTGANISSTRLKVITLTSSTLERDISLFFSVLQPLKKAFIAFAMIVFLRRLNQTGDKWIHLPDIGDWFAEQNKIILSIFLVISLSLLVLQLRTLNTPLQTVACIIACIAIYSYRGAIDSVIFFKPINFNSILVLPLFWGSAIYILASSYLNVMRNRISDIRSVNGRLVRLLGTNMTVFSLISALLHKPHNVILVFAMNFILNIGYSLCDNLGGPKKVVPAKCILGYKVALTVWISKMFYFYQGNSNNLGTIDLNPGYIGLSFYNPILVGTLITVNTYFAEIYGFLHLVLNVIQKENDISITKDINEFENHLKDDDNYSLVTTLMAAIKLSISSVYLILMIAFRYHLFIFTVFSPKVLYECFAILLFYVNFSMTNLYFSVLHKTLKI